MKVASGYNLTMPLDGAVRVRDYAQTLVLRNKTTLDGLQRISDLQLFPHTVTHIDLLPRIKWKALGIRHLLPKELRKSPENPSHNDRLMKNRVVPCTIVSLETMANTMREACLETWDRRLPRHPTQIWAEDTFRRLLKDLRITRKQLSATNIPKGDFVVFSTGWREFAPSDGDLTHAGWYPWHPYLMNPYLDEDAVKSLLDSADERGREAVGMGCDVGTLDSPLRFYSSAPEETCALPYLKECLKDRELCPSNELPRKARFRPVHISTLSRRRLLVEQLYIPATLIEAIQGKAPEGFPTKQGKLLLLPHPCHQAVDAVLVSAVFVPKEGEDETEEQHEPE